MKEHLQVKQSMLVLFGARVLSNCPKMWSILTLLLPLVKGSVKGGGGGGGDKIGKKMRSAGDVSGGQ